MTRIAVAYLVNALFVLPISGYLSWLFKEKNCRLKGIMTKTKHNKRKETWEKIIQSDDESKKNVLMVENQGNEK